MRGALFENFIVSELIKKRIFAGKTDELFFWRGKPHGQGSFTDGAGHVFNLEWVDGRQQGGMTPQEIEELRVWAFKKVDETIDSLINEIGENSDKNDADEDK